MAELHRLSTTPPWDEQVPYLVQLPGFGLLTAMTVPRPAPACRPGQAGASQGGLAAIGDVTRFPTDKHLVGYAGLGAGVHDSGQTHRDHAITKQGRRDLRHAWSRRPGAP